MVKNPFRRSKDDSQILITQCDFQLHPHKKLHHKSYPRIASAMESSNYYSILKLPFNSTKVAVSQTFEG